MFRFIFFGQDQKAISQQYKNFHNQSSVDTKTIFFSFVPSQLLCNSFKHIESDNSRSQVKPNFKNEQVQIKNYHAIYTYMQFFKLARAKCRTSHKQYNQD